MTSSEPAAGNMQRLAEDWVAREREALAAFRELMDATAGEQENALAELRELRPAVYERVQAMLARHREATDGDFRQAAAALFRPLPAQLGPFRIVGFIGEGGMAQVVRGVRTIDRGEQHVAIKLVFAPPSQHMLRERFLRERKLLARLRHPAIAQLIDFAETPDGLLWYAMALIDGVSIEQYVRQNHFGMAHTAGLIIELCDVLRYAHALGVIHRDIKPQNVLVNADGKLHLIDFGIAKELGDDAELTLHGGAPMTPHYASPEQRERAVITTAADQWQVAAMAYELLTGSRVDTLASDSPRRHRRYGALSPDLGAVLAKALRTEPEDRYESIALLGSDLRAAIEGRPVQARMGERWYEFRKFVSRHRWVISAAAVIVTSLLLAAWISLAAAGQAREQARIAERSNAVLSEIFLSDKQGLNLPQATLASFIANGVERMLAERELPDSARLKLLDTLAERAMEAGEYAAAERGAREALRLARAQVPADRLSTGNACSLLAFVLLYSSDRAKLDAEIQSLLHEARMHVYANDVPSVREAELRILVERTHAFHSAFQQDFDAAQRYAGKSAEIADQWLAHDPWAVIGARRTAAVMYEGAQRHTDAARVYREILGYADSQLAQHPTLAEFVQWDRTEHCSQLSVHDPAAAVVVCTENIALLEKSGQAGSKLAVEAVSSLGRSLARLGRSEEALQQYQRAERMLAALEGDATMSMQMASVRRRIGQRLLQLDRAAEAVLPLEFVLAVIRLRAAAGAPEQDEVRTELAQALARSGAPSRAKALLAEVRNPERMATIARSRYEELRKLGK
ncbi:MAG: serine/threonine protein kinase [Rhodanobacteraceae bacterium]|nr:serine/threonine protein kinase [Rhodanobacteraceae bacterium]